MKEYFIDTLLSLAKAGTVLMVEIWTYPTTKNEPSTPHLHFLEGQFEFVFFTICPSICNLLIGLFPPYFSLKVGGHIILIYNLTPRNATWFMS